MCKKQLFLFVVSSHSLGALHSVVLQVFQKNAIAHIKDFFCCQQNKCPHSAQHTCPQSLCLTVCPPTAFFLWNKSHSSTQILFPLDKHKCDKKKRIQQHFIIKSFFLATSFSNPRRQINMLYNGI